MEASRYALEEAARVAREEGAGRHGVESPAELILLSVVPPQELAPGPGGHMSIRPHALDDVALAHAFLRERGIEAEMKVAEGNPAEKIVEEARARRCDLIIVGTRGLGPMSRLLLGSVSSRVAETAPCPVTIAGRGRIEKIAPAAAA
jgi:nucleotide-binding universal stress UspA family protein